MSRENKNPILDVGKNDIGEPAPPWAGGEFSVLCGASKGSPFGGRRLETLEWQPQGSETLEAAGVSTTSMLDIRELYMFFLPPTILSLLSPSPYASLSLALQGRK